MIVMKFGGTSVGSAERMRNIVQLVKEREHQKPVIVVSAMSGMTDALIKAAYGAVRGTADFAAIEKAHQRVISELGLDPGILRPLFQELHSELNHISGFARLTPALLDKVCSFGERFSSRILSLYANTQGLPTIALDAYDIGMLTDGKFGNAEILQETYSEIPKLLMPQIENGKIPVTTGFIGRTKSGHITTLGRGGSDYSAAIFGAAIKAEEIQIWTDVNGVMTSDPKMVQGAKTVPQVSFAEAAELAYFGARVLHPKTLLPAMQKNITVRVLNTFEPNNPGTKIDAELTGDAKRTVKAIAIKSNVNLVTLRSQRMLLAHGFLHRVFKIFDEHELSVDMIATSEVSVSLTIDRGADIDGAIRELTEIADVHLERERSSIAIVGEGLHENAAMTQKIFNALAQQNIPVEMISQGASEISIGLVVPQDLAKKAVHTLHHALFEEVLA